MHELEQIINGCIRGIPQYQEMLYRYCFADMIKICLRYNPDNDAAAACYNLAMYKILSRIESYRNEGAFMGWVRTIMVNTCLNERRKTLPVTDTLSTAPDKAPPLQPEVYSKLGADEVLQLVRTLPPLSGLVFNLYVMDGHTHDQIAKLLGIATGTSKWHLNNARKRLQEKITNYPHIETDHYAIR
jgi:RNA polymerase sigma-70 factor, ECF subfamily